jgi:hypothetical protein
MEEDTNSCVWHHCLPTSHVQPTDTAISCLRWYTKVRVPERERVPEWSSTSWAQVPETVRKGLRKHPELRLQSFRASLRWKRGRLGH